MFLIFTFIGVLAACSGIFLGYYLGVNAERNRNNLAQAKTNPNSRMFGQ